MDEGDAGVQLRFCGLGGQGVLLMGDLLGRAAVARGLWVAGSNSYGAQARGSGCRSELVVAREPADFPHVLEADLLVALAQGAYELYLPEVRPEGLVVYDHPGVSPVDSTRAHLPVPATVTAVDRLGSRQMANTVLLGAVVALTGLLPLETVSMVAAASLEERFREQNQRALEIGFALGQEAAADHTGPLAAWRSRVRVDG